MNDSYRKGAVDMNNAILMGQVLKSIEWSGLIDRCPICNGIPAKIFDSIEGGGHYATQFRNYRFRDHRPDCALAIASDSTVGMHVLEEPTLTCFKCETPITTVMVEDLGGKSNWYTYKPRCQICGESVVYSDKGYIAKRVDIDIPKRSVRY